VREDILRLSLDLGAEVLDNESIKIVGPSGTTYLVSPPDQTPYPADGHVPVKQINDDGLRKSISIVCHSPDPWVRMASVILALSQDQTTSAMVSTLCT